MSSTKQVIALVAGALLLGSTPRARAQSGIPTRELPGATSAVTGTVVSSITTALVLRDDGGSEHTFFVDNTSALPAGLVPGMRVNVQFEPLKGGREHLISVGTSYAMDASQVEGPPQRRGAAAPRPSAEPTDPPAQAIAVSTSGVGDSAGLPNREPVRSGPRPHGSPSTPSGLAVSASLANHEPVPNDPTPDDAPSSLPNVLMTATLLVGAAIAFWWGRRAL